MLLQISSTLKQNVLANGLLLQLTLKTFFHDCDCVQEARYQDALQNFLQVQHVGGYRPDLSYNIALCQYMLKQYGAAHSCVGDIIAKGIKEHPGKYLTVANIWQHCTKK